MARYSHSRLSTFEQCKLKYKFKYIDKLKPDFEKTIESHLGSCVHNVLEWFYKNILKKRIPSLDELILEFTKNWKKEYKQNFKIVKNNLKAEDYFSKGIKFLIDYYIENQPFNDGTIEIEKKIEILIHPERKHKIIGFIDRLAYNLEKNRYEIHDYKTAGTLPSQEKIDSDRQLAIYGLAIKEIFGKDKEVALIWHYLDHNKKIISRRTNEQYENLIKEIIELIDKIENTKEFEANKSILCDWCEFKEKCFVWKN
jgi:RecB family exonuclease